ncbi:MAG TPA: MlaD family protein [Solirubrobacteraceae bacterium]|jgi:phospholipid/cholesterol/gamma-HCH transport system substrate-binding protein
MSRRTRIQLRRYGGHLVLLLILMVVGTAAGFFILLNQRLPNPFQSYYQVNGAFTTAAAVVPGLGEPVNVAGVRVGQINGTSLQDGQATVRMQIDPSQLPAIYRDAHADLVPRTPLKDMEVDIWPGERSSGRLPSGATIPIAQTISPVDSDEVLSALDGDTRTWLDSLLTSLGQATAGRAGDMRALLRAVGPTAGQLRQVGDLLAARHNELAQLTHNLGLLTQAASSKDAQIGQVIRASQGTVSALASQNVALRRAVMLLPGTLSRTRTTLGDLTTFSRALGPASTALRPVVRSLPSTLRRSQTLFRGAALLPLRQIRPFVQAALPLAQKLPPLAADLKIEVPDLIAAFKVLAYSANELAYNPAGKNPGFLYWLAWFAHNSDSFISSSDANGPVWRSVLLASCGTLKSLSVGPVLEQILGTNFGCK